mgnify:CR=1 FL=1
MPSALRAETYSKILIYPEHVGVFYNIGQQQFEAYGVTASGQTVRITDRVDWYLDENPFPIQTMKPNEVAEISETGLLKVKSKWGRVNVKACYPKGCGPSSSRAPVGLDLLLVPKYTVIPLIAGGGSVSPSSPQKVKKGQKAIFAVSEDSCFEVSAVNGDCGSVVDGTTIITQPVKDDCTVEVEFVQKNYTATPSVTGGTDCGIDPSTAQTMPCGSGITFTYGPPAGPGVAVLAATDTCGGSITDNGDDTWNYTISSLSADCNAVVSIVPAYIVTPMVTGGTVVPSTPQTEPEGGQVVFTYAPEASCTVPRIDTLDDCAGSLSDNGDGTWDYTIASLAGACTAAVEFYQPDYTATASVTGGFVDPASQTAACGSPVAFVFGPPTTGGDIAQLAAGDTCGGTLGAVDGSTWNYAVASLESDCTAAVEFVSPAPVQYTLTLTAANAGGEGRVYSFEGEADCDTGGIFGSCPSSFVYDSGTVITLNHQQELDGFPFPVGTWIGWSGDADCVDGMVTMNTDVNCTGTFGSP